MKKYVLLNALFLQMFGLPVILDVRGPHSIPPANLNNMTQPMNDTLSNMTVIHVMDEVDRAHMNTYKHHRSRPTLAPMFEDDEEERITIEESINNPLQNLTQTMDLRPDKPIVLYLWREQTGHNARVMQVLASLSALKHNEVCQIDAGNKHGMFRLKEKHGMSSLHFTRKVKHKSIHVLELVCKPVNFDGERKIKGSSKKFKVNLETFNIKLEIHIL